MPKLTFSPEIRLGDVIATLGVLAGVIFAYATVKTELVVVKDAQAAQVIVNREMRQEMREVANEIKTDIREMRQEMRRGTRM